MKWNENAENQGESSAKVSSNPKVPAPSLCIYNWGQMLRNESQG